MAALAEILLNIGILILPVVFAMIVGTILERRHFRSIEQREQSLGRIPVLNGKQIPDDMPVVESRFVSGSVVVSIDYFKRFLASLRHIFGGELRAYCSLLDRGRREAILRMKEEWPDAHLIANLRIETSSIAIGQKQGNRRGLGSTEVLAYGTAVRFGPRATDDTGSGEDQPVQ